MAKRLPVKPNIEQLENQTHKLLRLYRSEDKEAVSDFEVFYPRHISSKEAKLADAQLVVARSYGFSSWPRMRLAAQIAVAIYEEDLGELQSLVDSNPELLTEPVRGSAWGPPMSYAANLGRTAAVEVLLGMGATDIQKALGRALTRGKLDTARFLLAHGAKPHGCILGPCESLNANGIKLLLDHGADPNEQTDYGQTALEMAICTYTKNLRQHECVNLLIEAGAKYVDGPVMDIHRGRLDQLEKRLDENPNLVNEPIRLCRYYGGAGGGAPLNGATLLHVCAEYNEVEAAKILLDRGADVNRHAIPDTTSPLWPNRMEMWRSSTAGIGDQTPIFHAVNSAYNFCMPMVELLIEHGAALSLRASILLVDHDEVLTGITPLGYALRFRPLYDYRPHGVVVALLRQHGAEE